MVITVATTSMILTSSTLLSNSALKKVVKAPHIIANALDWKIGVGIPATVLTIDVYTDRIGLALATVDHDKQQQQQSNNNCTGIKYDQLTTRTAAAVAAVTNRSYFSCKVLDSIPLFPPSTNNKRRARNNNNKKKKKKKEGKRIAVSPEDKYRLLRLVREHSISGFIVSWPLQKDTGLMGASCGRTLFTIEQLLENDEEEKDYDNNYTKIFTPNRPICFWDGRMHNSNNNHNNNSDNETKQQEQEQPQPDIFGRCSIYARTSTRKEHRASKEQYYPQNEFSTMNAMKVWEDFYQTHWPITTTHNKNNNNSDVVDNDTIMQQQQRQEKQIKEEQQPEQLKQEREREKNHHVNYPTHNNSNDDVFRFSSLVQQPNNNSDSSNNDNNNDSNSNPELLSSPYISTRRRRTLAATSSLVSMA